MRPRVAHRNLVRSVNYKQGIQCWASNWQGFVPRVRNEQNNTRHTEVLKSSLRCTKPNTALQSSLRQSSNHCKTPNHAVHTLLEQCAEPRHTPHSAIVRPEPPPLCDGTSPLHSNTHSNTMVHSFQLVFQSRVRSGRSRRCVINKRKRALRNSNHDVQMHGTDRRCNTRTKTRSRSPTSQ